ncbi:lipid droplet-associated protein [Gordonia hankookensis]|uniref:Lipid droplet-associated protein n=1 Tax=Gordonia hankookensis TaxID=589403 RepID=A0ABR7WE50_9ACTN|nr:lipid droplet-associated protein [Gordonia hankookensis]MBD1321033.1 lipid droplet-associated protein [Gordonia hankookensis]
MVRAPYPARIAAGLVVTAIEETRKLPALVVTLPMTAVSQTLQAGMRVQQNIAELAIKGDLALETLFDKPSDQPEWARFDDDDDAIDAEADRTPIESRDGAGTPSTPVSENTSTDIGSSDAADAPTRSPAATKTPAEKPAAKKAPAKNAAANKVPAKKAPAKKAATTNSASPGDAAGADPAAGRFALYSAPPDGVVNADADKDGATKAAPAFDGPVPEIVEYIEYENLTLAQLRAKLRSVGVDELEQLAAYEKATRARAPFVTMIDNRIASQNSKRQQTT